MVDTHILATEKQEHYSIESFVKSFELLGFENKTFFTLPNFILLNM